VQPRASGKHLSGRWRFRRRLMTQHTHLMGVC